MAELKTRLREAMDLRKFKSIDLVNATGISAARVSQYLSGYAVPKQTAIYKMSLALNVSEAWLMGYDVPMARSKERQPTHEEVARVALFGGDTEVTDEMWEEVRQFAEFVKAKHKQRKTDAENADK